MIVYEEDALMRALLAEWLAEAGYEVRLAGTSDPHRTDPADLPTLFSNPELFGSTRESRSRCGDTPPRTPEKPPSQPDRAI